MLTCDLTKQDGAKQNIAENIAVVREHVQISLKDFASYPRFFTQDVVLHGPEIGERLEGLENLEKANRVFFDHFSSAECVIENLVGYDDKVFAYLHFYFRKDGKKITFPAQSFYRIRDRKIAELWVTWDRFAPLDHMARGLKINELDRHGQKHNIALVKRYFEHNLTKVQYFPEFFSDDVVRHGPNAGEVIEGLANLIEVDKKRSLIFADLEGSIGRVFAHGNKVATWWAISGYLKTQEMATAIPGSLSGMSIYRFENGKIAEQWVLWDQVGLLNKIAKKSFFKAFPVLAAKLKGFSQPTERSIELVRRFFETDIRDVRRYEQFMTNDIVRHGPKTGEQIEGLENLIRTDRERTKEFYALNGHIEQVVANGNRVFTCWTATGYARDKAAKQNRKEIFVAGQAIYRLEKEKIAEWWILWNELDVLKQLGEDGSPPIVAEPIAEKYLQGVALLTSREKDCLRSILQAKTAKETAADLHISHRTVECYFENTKSKLNCGSKRELFTAAQALDRAGMLKKNS